MLSLDDFKKIDLSDKIVFDKHYQRFPPTHSGELFTTMISWGEYAEYHYALIENSIIIFSKTSNEIILHPPSGKFNLDLTKQVINLAKKENMTFGFIKKIEKNLLSTHFPSSRVHLHSTRPPQAIPPPAPWLPRAAPPWLPCGNPTCR